LNRVALIGFPLRDSVSPGLHNAAFRAVGLFDWVYELHPTRPDELHLTVEEIKRERFAGAHISIPHKQNILPLLDESTVTARLVGAVNTIVLRDGKLIGDNTENTGFVNVLAESQINPHSANVVLFGASSLAHSIANVLGQARIRRLTIFNRTLLHAARLADKMHLRFSDLELSVNRVNEIERANLIINTSSVGMNPLADATPMPIGAKIPQQAIVIDLVYNPPETRLCREAKQAGASTIMGDAMLLHSSAASFKIWTGRDAPIAVMKQALNQALASNSTS
jgi:shikimate dehydrogenase